MSFADIALLVMIAAGALYGGLRGIRPALYLLVTLLMSILAMLLFTTVLETLILNLSGIGSDTYPGAPAVAVLILEDQVPKAYLASLIPSILLVFGFLILIVGQALLRPLMIEASRSKFSHIAGLVCGLVSGIVAALLSIIQLMRLPWPPAGQMLRNSLIMAALTGLTEFLIPPLVGIL